MNTKLNQHNSRQAIAAAIFVCYLLPVLLLSIYSLIDKNSWGLFSIGLTSGICGATVLFLFICRWTVALRKQGKAPEIDRADQIMTTSKLSFVETEPPIPFQNISETPLTVQDALLEDPLQKDLSECQTRQTQLLSEIDLKNNALQALYSEKEQLQRHMQSILQEFSSYKSTMQEQVQQKEILIRECKQSLIEQQSLLETKQQQITSLENKEHDLTYEIKMLLQLINTENPTPPRHETIPHVDELEASHFPPYYDLKSPSEQLILKENNYLYSHSDPFLENTLNHQPPPNVPIPTNLEASHFPPCYSLKDPGLLDQDSNYSHQAIYTPETPWPLQASPLPDIAIDDHEVAETQLKRCLDIATKMTGSTNIGGTSRVRDLQVDSYALDLRRLCDSLRVENSCIVILFSQKENKLLFVNNHVKNITGWSPEKFLQDFPEIIQNKTDVWNAGISQLASYPEVKLSLPIKTKDGHEIRLHCLLGAINTGLFRHHVIGILS